MTEPGEKPKHKPSQKHTLDEVLRSLQDMIRHELAGAPSIKPAGGHTTAPAHSADIHADLEKALDTLKSDLENSLQRTGGPAPFESLDALLPMLGTPPAGGARPKPQRPGQGKEATVLTDPPPYTARRKELPELRADHAADAPAAPVDQRDLPFLDDLAPAGDMPTPPLEQPPSPARPGLAGVPTAHDDSYPPNPLLSTAASDAEAIAREEALLADSIPVLTDAVVFPDAGGEADTGEALQIEVPLPNPDRARVIAIRVAATLNIEMRKSGRRGLSTPAIIRLAQLLRDALAQAESNVDNSGHKPD
jgi:hypothetical protein